MQADVASSFLFALRTKLSLPRHLSYMIICHNMHNLKPSSSVFFAARMMAAVGSGLVYDSVKCPTSILKHAAELRTRKHSLEFVSWSILSLDTTCKLWLTPPLRASHCLLYSSVFSKCSTALQTLDWFADGLSSSVCCLSHSKGMKQTSPVQVAIYLCGVFLHDRQAGKELY